MRIVALIHCLFILLNASCKEKETTQSKPTMKTDTTKYKHTNKLINETSPYLLQHAHNPVNWYPWGEEALQKAQKENKIIIISVGYSACHWCHVMEHESFEDEEVAALMNEHFVAIKVDREERPDVDQVYMDAVHLMGQRGGWPLNAFALPNGKPFYGGTYFPKETWMKLLNKVHEEHSQFPEKVEEYANKLALGIQQAGLITMNTNDAPFKMETLDNSVSEWSKSFDIKEGGSDRAPKFPLPNSWEFLLQYYYHTKNKDYLNQVEITLEKMAFGGIYDHLGGGFARYSTDKYWKVPHFEKMLYDNAQLVSLYSKAYQLTKNPLYKKVVFETLEYIEREMTSKEGAFYSALDADSEGEEGKFYIWKKEELEKIVDEDYNVFAEYYSVDKTGYWEHDNYILLRSKTAEEIAKKHNITEEELNKKIDSAKKKLMKERDNRIRPGLDDKTLTSWNALMIKGYIDAYLTFGKREHLNAALKNGNFLLEKQLRKDGGLNHSYKEGESKINGYLEDYSFTIEAFITLYEATFDQKWLDKSRALADYSIIHFFDANSGMFWFTSDEDKKLVARKMEYKR